MADVDVDFTITVSIPESELRNPGSKQYTAYHVQVSSFSCKTQRSMEWRVLRRYSEFLGLYQQLRKGYPKQFVDVVFPSKRMIGRFNPEFVERRRTQLQRFLEQTMEHPEIINSSPELRAFVEIDKNLTLVMEKEKEDLRSMVEQAIDDPVKQQQLQFARCLFDFEARNEEELALQAGDILVVTDMRDNNGWWQGQFHGRCGFFPINYVEKLDDVPENVEEIIRGPGTAAPVVPSPAVPKRLSMAVQTKRRTNLLDKMAVERALEAQAQQERQQKEDTAPGDRAGAAVPEASPAPDRPVAAEEVAPGQDNAPAAAAAPASDGAGDAAEGGEASEEDASDVQPRQADAAPAAAPAGGVIGDERSMSSTLIEMHPRASLDSNGLMYVRGIAKYGFKGETAYELSFAQGAEVDVYTIDHSTGWWQGKSGGHIGYFPGTYVDVPEFAEDVLPVEKEDGTDGADAGGSDAAADSSAAASGASSDGAPQRDNELAAATVGNAKKERLTQLGAKIMPMVPSKEDVERSLAKRKTRVEQQQPKVTKVPAEGATAATATGGAGAAAERNDAALDLACILCVCEHWHPLEWEHNMCKNCRHLKKMHRAKRR